MATSLKTMMTRLRALRRPSWRRPSWTVLHGGRIMAIMALSPFGVRAAAGSLRGVDGVVLQHTWTGEGVVADPVANGAHLLHLSVAMCVLNDIYREAQRFGVAVDGVAVEADGGFDGEWRSTGIEYAVTVDTQAAQDVASLLAVVDELAEVPRALRTGMAVARKA